MISRTPHVGALTAARSSSKVWKCVFTSHAEAAHLPFFPPPPSQQLLCVSKTSFSSTCLCLSWSDNTCFAPNTLPALSGFSWTPVSFQFFFLDMFCDLCFLSVLRIAGLNHAVRSVCDSPTEWLRGHHFQPVRDCGAAPPCQPVIISTRRPLFFSVARSLALSCSNRMITGC